jgi:hypothetical protein
LKKYVSADISFEIERIDEFFIVKGPFNVIGKGFTEEEAVSNFKEEFELYIEEWNFINK